MSWEDQGRQYHMWFGNGTAADKAIKAAPDSSVVGQSTADRVLALAYGALASLPTAQRRQAEAQYDAGTLPRLKEAMTAWLRGTALNQATFASRLFGRSANDPWSGIYTTQPCAPRRRRPMTPSGKPPASSSGSTAGRALSPTPKSAPATQPRRPQLRRAGSRLIPAATRSGQFIRLRLCSASVLLA